MVGCNFLADHACGLDDGYEGANGHAGSRFHERGVTCCDLFLKTEEERADCLGCSHGSCRCWDATTIVSCCCSDSWNPAQKRVRERQNMVVFLCVASRGLSRLAL